MENDFENWKTKKLKINFKMGTVLCALLDR